MSTGRDQLPETRPEEACTPAGNSATGQQQQQLHTASCSEENAAAMAATHEQRLRSEDGNRADNLARASAGDTPVATVSTGPFPKHEERDNQRNASPTAHQRPEGDDVCHNAAVDISATPHGTASSPQAQGAVSASSHRSSSTSPEAALVDLVLTAAANEDADAPRLNIPAKLRETAEQRRKEKASPQTPTSTAADHGEDGQPSRPPSGPTTMPSTTTAAMPTASPIPQETVRERTGATPEPAHDAGWAEADEEVFMPSFSSPSYHTIPTGAGKNRHASSHDGHPAPQAVGGAAESAAPLGWPNDKGTSLSQLLRAGQTPSRHFGASPSERPSNSPCFSSLEGTRTRPPFADSAPTAPHFCSTQQESPTSPNTTAAAAAAMAASHSVPQRRALQPTGPRPFPNSSRRAENAPLSFGQGTPPPPPPLADNGCPHESHQHLQPASLLSTEASSRPRHRRNRDMRSQEHVPRAVGDSGSDMMIPSPLSMSLCKGSHPTRPLASGVHTSSSGGTLDLSSIANLRVGYTSQTTTTGTTPIDAPFSMFPDSSNHPDDDVLATRSTSLRTGTDSRDVGEEQNGNEEDALFAFHHPASRTDSSTHSTSSSVGSHGLIHLPPPRVGSEKDAADGGANPQQVTHPHTLSERSRWDTVGSGASTVAVAALSPSPVRVACTASAAATANGEEVSAQTQRRQSKRERDTSGKSSPLAPPNAQSGRGTDGDNAVDLPSEENNSPAGDGVAVSVPRTQGADKDCGPDGPTTTAMANSTLSAFADDTDAPPFVRMSTWILSLGSDGPNSTAATSHPPHPSHRHHAPAQASGPSTAPEPPGARTEGDHPCGRAVRHGSRGGASSRSSRRSDKDVSQDVSLDNLHSNEQATDGPALYDVQLATVLASPDAPPDVAAAVTARRRSLAEAREKERESGEGTVTPSAIKQEEDGERAVADALAQGQRSPHPSSEEDSLPRPLPSAMATKSSETATTTTSTTTTATTPEAQFFDLPTVIPLSELNADQERVLSDQGARTLPPECKHTVRKGRLREWLSRIAKSLPRHRSLLPAPPGMRLTTDHTSLCAATPTPTPTPTLAPTSMPVVPEGVRHASLFWVLLLYVVVIVSVALFTFLTVYVVTRRITHGALEEMHAYLRQETILFTEATAFLPAMVTQTLASLFISDPTSPSARSLPLPPDRDITRILCSAIRDTGLSSLLSSLTYISFNGSGRVALCEHGGETGSLSALLHGPEHSQERGTSVLHNVDPVTLEFTKPLRVDARFPERLSPETIAAVTGSGSVVSEWLAAIDRTRRKADQRGHATSTEEGKDDGGWHTATLRERVPQSVQFWRTTRRDRPTVVYTHPFFEGGATRPSYISCRIDATHLLDVLKGGQSDHVRKNARVMLVGGDYGVAPTHATDKLAEYGEEHTDDIVPFVLACSWCEGLPVTRSLHADGDGKQWVFARHRGWTSDIDVADPLMAAALQKVDLAHYVRRAHALVQRHRPREEHSARRSGAPERDGAFRRPEGGVHAPRHGRGPAALAKEDEDEANVPADASLFDERGEYKVFPYAGQNAAVSVYPVRTASNLTMVVVIATSEAILEEGGTVTSARVNVGKDNRIVNVTFLAAASTVRWWHKALNPLSSAPTTTVALALACVCAASCVYCVIAQGMQAPLQEIVLQLEEATVALAAPNADEESDSSESEDLDDDDNVIRGFLSTTSHLSHDSAREGDSSTSNGAASRKHEHEPARAVPRGQPRQHQPPQLQQRDGDSGERKHGKGGDSDSGSVSSGSYTRRPMARRPQWRGTKLTLKEVHTVQTLCEELQQRMREVREFLPEGILFQPSRQTSGSSSKGGIHTVMPRDAGSGTRSRSLWGSWTREADLSQLTTITKGGSNLEPAHGTVHNPNEGQGSSRSHKSGATATNTVATENTWAVLPSFASGDEPNAGADASALARAGRVNVGASGEENLTSTQAAASPPRIALDPPTRLGGESGAASLHSQYNPQLAMDGGTQHTTATGRSVDAVTAAPTSAPSAATPAASRMAVAAISTSGGSSSAVRHSAAGDDRGVGGGSAIGQGVRALFKAWRRRALRKDKAAESSSSRRGGNTRHLVVPPPGNSAVSPGADGGPHAGSPRTSSSSPLLPLLHGGGGGASSLSASTTTHSPSPMRTRPMETLHDGTRYAKCFCTSLSVLTNLHINGGGGLQYLPTITEVVVAAARKYRGAFDIFEPEMLYLSFGSREPTKDHALLGTKCGIEIHSQLPPEALPYVTMVVDTGVYYTGVCGVPERKGFVLWGRPSGEMFALHQIRSGFRFFVLDTVVPLIRAHFRVLPVDTIRISEEKGSPQVIFFVLFKGSVTTPSWAPFRQLFNDAFTCLIAKRYDQCVRILETILGSSHFPYYGIYMLAYARDQHLRESRKQLGKAEMARQISEIAVTVAQEMMKHGSCCLPFGCTMPGYIAHNFPENPYDDDEAGGGGGGAEDEERRRRLLLHDGSAATGGSDSSSSSASNREADIDEPRPHSTRRKAAASAGGLPLSPQHHRPSTAFLPGSGQGASDDHGSDPPSFTAPRDEPPPPPTASDDRDLCSNSNSNSNNKDHAVLGSTGTPTAPRPSRDHRGRSSSLSSSSLLSASLAGDGDEDHNVSGIVHRRASSHSTGTSEGSDPTTASSRARVSPLAGTPRSRGPDHEESPLYTDVSDEDGTVHAFASLPLLFCDVAGKLWRRSLRPKGRRGASRTEFAAVSSSGVMAALSLYPTTDNYHHHHHHHHNNNNNSTNGNSNGISSTLGVATTSPNHAVAEEKWNLTGGSASGGGGAPVVPAARSPLGGSATAETGSSSSSSSTGAREADTMAAATTIFHENIVQYISCAIVVTAPTQAPQRRQRRGRNSSSGGSMDAGSDDSPMMGVDGGGGRGSSSLHLTAAAQPPRTYFCLIQEFVPGGSLRESVERYGRPLPLGAIRRYCVSILRALEYLHKKHVTHGLLSPDNVLVGVEGTCKIKGMSYLFDWAREDEELYGALVEGTACYMSPEVVMGGEKTSASDVFSFGLILLEMLTGTAPWTWTGTTPHDVSARSREELQAILHDNKVFKETSMQGTIEMRQYGRRRNRYNVTYSAATEAYALLAHRAGGGGNPQYHPFGSPSQQRSLTPMAARSTQDTSTTQAGSLAVPPTMSTATAASSQGYQALQGSTSATTATTAVQEARNSLTHHHHHRHPVLDMFCDGGVEADPGMLQVLEDCLSFDPRHRKTASQLLQKLSEM